MAYGSMFTRSVMRLSSTLACNESMAAGLGCESIGLRPCGSLGEHGIVADVRATSRKMSPSLR
jgi:hypothetical protein